MKKFITIIMLHICFKCGFAQKMTVAQMKLNIEKASNPIAYVRDILKKQYKLDTIIVANTSHFTSIADSLAYYGKIKKVYGPITKKYLVQVLGKLPNTFTRISQIFIDTTIFTRRIADSLANSIIQRINDKVESFENMALTYSMGGEAFNKGDLGWMARGATIPEIEKEMSKRKKGDVFKVWTSAGVHIIKKTSDPKSDTGFALIMRILL